MAYIVMADSVITLAGRIGILTNGQLQCVGSTAALQSRFGDTYLVELCVRATASVDSVLAALCARLTDASVVERFGRQLKLDAPKRSNELSFVFSVLEDEAQTLGVEFFSVSEASMEQIFLRFASKQEIEVDK